jgi:hypothetical protein
LAYFDVFNYPLTNIEVRRFLPYKCNQLVVDEILSLLTRENRIYKLNDFYSLQNESQLADIRIAGNNRAIKLLKIAQGAAKVLSWFPFVESVAVSGSLSKNFADQNADIDFFIITSANRLWTARTCMHIFKKFTYLVRKQSWFCMNYYIDEMQMEIVEKNHFTAMEIVTLMPMQGINCFRKFIEANSWTCNYFRRQTFFEDKNIEIKKVFFRRCVEKIFSSPLGDLVENWLMNITDKRWKRKTERGKVNDHGAIMAMVIDPHFSKPDPAIFQEKIVQQFEEKLRIYKVNSEVVIRGQVEEF